MPKKINTKKRNVKKKFKFFFSPSSKELCGDPFRAADLQRNERFFERPHRSMPQSVIVPKGGINTRGELGTAPAHYSNGKYTPWEVIDDWKLDYYTGNALKYVCRHLHKGKPVEDIQKAIDCLIKYKQNLEKEKV